MIAQQNYQAGIYARLSKDDDTEGESVSIENQKLLLTQYAKERGLEVVDYYVDDGWSGTRFDRPGFLRMRQDIESKRINLVLVKDLSRLGRNNSKTEEFITDILPAYNCHLIAVNDGVDTLYAADDVSISFRNMFNDFFARDTSKKIRAVRKANAKNGMYMGQRPPYGYRKSAEDKHILEPDPVTAPVVQFIFSLRRDGNGYAMIARRLNNDHIMPPNDYFYKSQGKENPFPSSNLWSQETVKSIMRNEVYIGNMVQQKQGSISYKDHRLRNKPKDEWIRVEHTHEPIIDMETWEAVRALDGGGFKPRTTNTGIVGLFSGFLKCADCGYGMKRNVAHKPRSGGIIKEYISYLCIKFNQSGKTACSSHTISEEPLKEVVLNDIREKVAMINMDEKGVIEAIQAQQLKASKDSYQLQKAEKGVVKKRLAELEKLIQSLYENKVIGEVSPDIYAKLMPKYEAEMKQKEARLAEIETELSTVQEVTTSAEEWVALMKRYRDVSELSRELLANLIEKIEIGEAVVVDGQKQREIRIHYKFVGYIG